MWKMLPIPAPLIDSTSLENSNYFSVRQPQRLFLPLIYLGATASLCYLFLFALVISNENPHFRGEERGSLLQLTFGHNSEKHNPQALLRVQNTEENIQQERDRRQHSGKLALSTSTSTLLTSRTEPGLEVGRKTLVSLRKKRKSHLNNGTRRSHPSEIRTGHQDLDPKNTLNFPPKGYKHSSKLSVSTGVYYYPWKNEQCKNYYVHFAEKNTFKPRALVSFPGSGNSWLRYLIENASGYFTGSVYNDAQLYNSGLMGELQPPNDGTTIVQKTHHNTAGAVKDIKGYVKLSELMFGYRGILLIRNPYDALISYRNFLRSQSGNKHTGTAKYNEFVGQGWITYVLTYIPLWTSLIMSWVENSQDLLIVVYEDMQKDPRRELTRILEYLNQPVDTKRLDCLMKAENLEGPFHRAHLIAGWTPNNKSTSDINSTPANSIWQSKLKVEPSSPQHHHNHDHHHVNLNSEKSPQPHPQYKLETQSTPQRQATIRGIEKQKEDTLYLLPTPLSFVGMSSKKFLQQWQNQYNSSMTSGSSGTTATNDTTTSSLSDDNHNRLNKGSILRLDLIIQDNIDKINRFFQQKSIPVQLHYYPRPRTIPYFLHTYTVNATTAASITRNYTF